MRYRGATRHHTVVDLDEPIAALVAAAQRLVALAAGIGHGDGGRLCDGEVSLNPATGELAWPGGTGMLPPVLAALAAALMRAPGCVVPRGELLRAMGYWAAPGSTRRLDCAMSRLRRVLPGEIRTCRAAGYRWLPPEVQP